jgi:hypothetical protein
MPVCACGCGAEVTGLVLGKPRRYISGHNLKGIKRTPEYCARIGEGQRRAWQSKRQRLPIGTKRVDGSGYVVVKVEPGAGRWVQEHILVVQEILGRSLSAKEIVHHINGDRQDNRAENLYICRDKKHHSEVHRSEADALRQMLYRGLVVFRDGHYEAILSG